MAILSYGTECDKVTPSGLKGRRLAYLKPIFGDCHEASYKCKESFCEEICSTHTDRCCIYYPLRALRVSRISQS
jgi:hypothetical protein